MAVMSSFFNLHKNCNYMNWAESHTETFDEDTFSISFIFCFLIFSLVSLSRYDLIWSDVKYYPNNYKNGTSVGVKFLNTANILVMSPKWDALGERMKILVQILPGYGHEKRCLLSRPGYLVQMTPNNSIGSF